MHGNQIQIVETFLFTMFFSWLGVGNGLHKNSNFTVHTFEDEKVYFFDLLIDRKTRDIVHKNTHTH